MNLNNFAILMGTAAILVAGPAFANEETSNFDYSYLEAQFLHTNFDTDEFTVTNAGTVGTFTDATSNGFGLEGAFGGAVFGDSLNGYVIGDFMSFDADLGAHMQGVITGSGNVPVDFTEWRLGGGVAYELDPRFAVFAEAGYLNTKIEFGSISGIAGGPIGLQGLDLSDGGIDLRIGFRAVPIDHVELFGNVRHNPHGEIENTGPANIGFASEFRYTLGGRYRFSDHMSVGAEYEFGEPGTARLSVRYSF